MLKTRRNKSFKSILLIFTVIGLLLSISVYSYFKFREYSAYRHVIHADASFIVKIDADKIYRSLFFDYLSNPSYYHSRNNNGTESGLAIPGHVFIYTVRSKSDLSYFCSLPIADLALLKQFIKLRLGIENFKKEKQEVSTGTSKDQKLTVAFNAETFALAYSFQKESVNDVLTDLLNKKNLLAESDAKIAGLKKVNAHLAYAFEGFSGSGEFKDGMIHVKGDFNFKDLRVRGNAFNHREFDKNAAIKMWLHAQILLNKPHTEIQLKERRIYPDSLLKYYNGYFDVELRGSVNQIDTVLTYEYNDDFEKEEIRRTRVVKVPRLSGTFCAKSEPLSNHLLKEGILRSDGVISKQIFPLYTLYGKGNAGAFMLSTDKDRDLPALSQKSPYFFYLGMNFKMLEAQRQFPWLERHVKPLSSMWIKALKAGAEKNHFEMAVNFKMKNINALTQLL